MFLLGKFSHNYVGLALCTTLPVQPRSACVHNGNEIGEELFFPVLCLVYYLNRTTLLGYEGFDRAKPNTCGAILVFDNDMCDRRIGKQFQELWPTIVYPRTNFFDHPMRLIAFCRTVPHETIGLRVQVGLVFCRRNSCIHRHTRGRTGGRFVLGDTDRTRRQLVSTDRTGLKPTPCGLVANPNLFCVVAQLYRTNVL